MAGSQPTPRITRRAGEGLRPFDPEKPALMRAKIAGDGFAAMAARRFGAGPPGRGTDSARPSAGVVPLPNPSQARSPAGVKRGREKSHPVTGPSRFR